MQSQRIRDLELAAKLIVAGRTHRGTVRAVDAPDLLLCDYDGPAPRFPVMLENLRRLGLEPLGICYAPSSTRGHWHVIVKLQKPRALAWRLFAQLFCGSDRERERNNFVRACIYGRTDSYVQILFEGKL